MRAFAILVIACLSGPPLAYGQSIAAVPDEAEARTYHVLREDDDWRFLANQSERQEF